MNNFETIIGIEIHLALNTKRKMFSYALNVKNDTPNKHIAPHDLGYPGTLPFVNFEAVEKALILAKSLDMKIADYLSFDRKHYFYYDLPKGFQITQHQNPIGKNGRLKISNKEVQIEQIQIEEDTAKSIKKENSILLDYNRSGVPLIEIVTAPIFDNSNEVTEYIKKIQILARNLDISSAKLEEGSMRADVNISHRLIGAKEFGTKVEIKNLNSLSNIKKAIDYEIDSQISDILNGKKILQATKRFDEGAAKTELMRMKVDAIDYRFFGEPNILPIKITQNFNVDEIFRSIELPDQKVKRYMSWNVDRNNIDFLISNPDYAKYFDAFKYSDKKKLSFIFFQEIKPKIENEDFFNWEVIAEIDNALNDMDNGNISSKQIKVAINKIYDLRKSYASVAKEFNLKQISDEKVISDILQEIINENLDFIEKNRDRKERVFKFLIGNLMKKTKGQSNPIVAQRVLAKILGEKIV